jgi:alpha-amylase
MVLKPQYGGQLESNPFTGTQTYTNFNGASENFQEPALIFKKFLRK